MISEERYRPLRYRISSWMQLPGCISNNSDKLSLHVSDFFKDDNFRGLRISVEHEIYGTLFATVFNAEGLIISPYKYTDEEGDLVYSLPVQDVLNELAKFGFFIEYEPREHISGDQIQYLMTVQKLGYDKLRRMETWEASTGLKKFTSHIVVFKSKNLGMWMNNGYSASEKEFTDALMSGDAVDITHICCGPKFDWSWLDYIANIEDIFRDNLGSECQYRDSDGGY